jgi:hypothetical protein
MTNTLPVAYYLSDVDGDSPRRGPKGMSPFGSASDIEARIADAHARGVLEGHAAAQVENDAALARQIAEAAQALKKDRQRWSETEGTRLSGLMTDAMADLEQRIANQVARCLKQVLDDGIRQRAVAQLSVALDDLLRKGEYAAISISGPDDLLAAMQAKLDAHHPRLTFIPSDGTDLVVSADETILETRIAAWSAAIHGEDA